MSRHVEPTVVVGIETEDGAVPRAADVSTPVRGNGNAPLFQSVTSYDVSAPHLPQCP